jgi:hypothetical protein
MDCDLCYFLHGAGKYSNNSPGVRSNFGKSEVSARNVGSSVKPERQKQIKAKLKLSSISTRVQ